MYLPVYSIIITESLKDRMHEQHTNDIEQLTHNHESQLETARMELERAVEISRQRVWL